MPVGRMSPNVILASYAFGLVVVYSLAWVVHGRIRSHRRRGTRRSELRQKQKHDAETMSLIGKSDKAGMTMGDRFGPRYGPAG